MKQKFTNHNWSLIHYKSLEKSTKKSTNTIDPLIPTPSPKNSIISPKTKTTTKKETKSRKVTQK